MAMRSPSALVTRVCQTIVLLPRWMGVHSPLTVVSMGAARRKLVFDSRVVVQAPGGSLRKVAKAPRASARDLTAQIGRAACRASGWQYEATSVVIDLYKKTTN